MNYSNLIDCKIKSPKCINQYQPRDNNYSTGKFTNAQNSVPKARLKFYMKRDCEQCIAYPYFLCH